MWCLMVLLVVSLLECSSSSLVNITCQIALRQAAQITIIYRCVSCVASNSPEFLEQELQLHQCVGQQLPMLVRSIEAFEMEPVRHTDSINIFHIPAGSKGEPLVRRILDMLNPRQPRKHLQKYLFLWPEANERQLQELFEGCWAKQLLFGLAITQVEGGIYDFYPFGTEGTLQLMKLQQMPYFRDKMLNLHGYQLRFSMFTDPLLAVAVNPVEQAGFKAVDGSAVRVVAEMLNATALYVLPEDNESYGRCLPDGNFSGVVKDMLNGKTHFGGNSRFILDCMYPHVEFLYPYTRRILYLVVPAAGLQPEYLIFLRAFHPHVWYLLGANFLLVFGLFWLLQHFLEKIPRRDVTLYSFKWYEIFEIFAKTHVGEPVSRLANISSMRAFLMAWIMFSYVVTTIYFAQLESGFVQPSYEAQLDTLEGLPRLQIRVYAIVTMFDAVKPTLSDEHYEILTSRSKPLFLNRSGTYFELSISRREKRSAFIMRDFHAKDFLTQTYNTQEDRPSYHIMREYLRSMVCTYILPRGSPFLYKFQALFSGFHEHGFFEYWRRLDVIRRSGISSEAEEFYEDLGDETDVDSTQTETKSLKHVVLTLDILQGAFYLWFVGIVMSLLGFLMELATYLWKRCNRVSVLVV